MTKLTTLRIALTLGAIVGIAPVTVIFLWGLPAMVLAIFYTRAQGWAAAAILVSLLGLWGCWKAYKAAIASKPQPGHDWKVIAAVVIAIAWGITWSSGWGRNPWVYAVFLMPGLTATLMLVITALRARRDPQGYDTEALSN